ncbi:hypothetical protein GA0074695_1006 [Micromonospora viridifaciens]|uniref:HNH endonuclease n=1 Tax=Micromonospora viridifaciens TaxID=1881 RepID=A0A1C4V0B7_MICVI|nr:HNH endonuclease signature motif containing protein [Micromonospora viridifaciens]SCE77460.1 hypothetical protein GA0074695_1006 [Micromonospora viridifaciens]
MASQPKRVTTTPKACRRVSLTDATKRRLWSESGGFCANPGCAVALFDDDADVDFAEMAHIIAASSGGPRDVDVSQLSGAQRAHHSNVVVLCANCHTKVDKAPETYPTQLLQQWKARHEETLRRVFGTPAFSTREEAREFIEPLLDENRSIFLRYGPAPGDFSESRASQWRRHVARSILPNNEMIARVLKVNRPLLGQQERHVANLFFIHMEEFSARHVLNEWGANSTRFPDGMNTIFEGEAE